VCGLYAMSCDE